MQKIEAIMDNLNLTTKKKYFTEKEAAKMLGLGFSTLKLIRYRGLISFARVGRRILYTWNHLEKFISAREVEAENQ